MKSGNTTDEINTTENYNKKCICKNHSIGLVPNSENSLCNIFNIQNSQKREERCFRECLQTNTFHMEIESIQNDYLITKPNCSNKFFSKTGSNSFDMDSESSAFEINQKSFDINQMNKFNNYDSKQMKETSPSINYNNQSEEKEQMRRLNEHITNPSTCQLVNYYQHSKDPIAMVINENGVHKEETLFTTHHSEVCSNDSKPENCFDYPGNSNFFSYGLNQSKTVNQTLWSPQQNYKYNNESIPKNDEYLSKFYSLPLHNYYKEFEGNSENKHFISNGEKTNKYVNDLRQFYLHQHGQIESPNHFSHETSSYGNMIPECHVTNESKPNCNTSNVHNINKNIFPNIVAPYTSEQYYKTGNTSETVNASVAENEHKDSTENRIQLGFSNYLSIPAIKNAEPKEVDEHRVLLKVVSPNGKNESQDDGYETSAGDVLTPNSYSSSSAATPHNQSITHGSNLHKTEDLMNKTMAINKIETRLNCGDHSDGEHLNDDTNRCIPELGEKLEGSIEQCLDAIENTKKSDDHNLQKSYDQCFIDKPIPKKRGRKKKISNMVESSLINKKHRKKHDRFNGLPEEEVIKRTVPDQLSNNMDILIVGINPSLYAAYKGHHYAGPGNHFWKCLFLSGLIPEQMSAEDDFKLLNFGIGFTNLVARPTKTSSDLTRKEIKEGSEMLLEKLQKYKPKIAVFNGKYIFEVFSGKKDFNFGKQPEYIDGTNTLIWVMPSSSARCAQLPRATDKIPFFSALKKLRDVLNGTAMEIDHDDYIFTEEKIKVMCSIKEYCGETLSKKEDNPTNKKKRGRPKKIKIENYTTSSELIVESKDLKCNDVGNVLNLSLMKETVKKKRGRPKKIREGCLSNILECHINTNNTICSTINQNDDQMSNSKHFKDCATNEKNLVFQSISPIRSPMVNCSYTNATPPIYSKPGTPVFQNASREMGIEGTQKNYVEFGKEKCAPIYQHLNNMTETNVPQFGDTPPPSSPNICADFDPPGSEQTSENMQVNQRVSDNQEEHFSIAKNSDGEEGKHSEFQNWITPQNNLCVTEFSNNQTSIGYHINQNENFHDNRVWQKRHIYDEGEYQRRSTDTIINSKDISGNQTKQQISDMSKKSLSGLESLVDQIPTSAESNHISCENDTLGLSSSSGPSSAGLFERNSNDPKINNSQQDSLRKCTINNNRFSVNNIMEFNTNERKHPYHSDIMAAAALAAVVNQNNNSTHHAQHASLYLDQHIPHVATNSLYGSGSHTNTHHGVPHHHATFTQSHVEYATPYSIPGHVNSIHMPSPNYPYTFSTASGQSGYTNYIHPGHQTHSHPSNHLSMYDRLKCSNIGNYSGGF